MSLEILNSDGLPEYKLLDRFFLEKTWDIDLSFIDSINDENKEILEALMISWLKVLGLADNGPDIINTDMVSSVRQVLQEHNYSMEPTYSSWHSVEFLYCITVFFSIKWKTAVQYLCLSDLSCLYSGIIDPHDLGETINQIITDSFSLMRNEESVIKKSIVKKYQYRISDSSDY